MSERTVYVTAFGPFPGMPDNPSSVIVEQTIASRVLDLNLEVSVEAVDIAVNRYHRLIHESSLERRPVVIHFGVNEEATSVTLERFARNHVT